MPSYEPRAINRYRVIPRIWKSWTEEEKNHFNKLFAFAWFHREHFTETVVPYGEWWTICHRMAMYSVNVHRRGRAAKYRVWT